MPLRDVSYSCYLAYGAISCISGLTKDGQASERETDHPISVSHLVIRLAIQVTNAPIQWGASWCINAGAHWGSELASPSSYPHSSHLILKAPPTLTTWTHSLLLNILTTRASLPSPRRLTPLPSTMRVEAASRLVTASSLDPSLYLMTSVILVIFTDFGCSPHLTLLAGGMMCIPCLYLFYSHV